MEMFWAKSYFHGIKIPVFRSENNIIGDDKKCVISYTQFKTAYRNSKMLLR